MQDRINLSQFVLLERYRDVAAVSGGAAVVATATKRDEKEIAHTNASSYQVGGFRPVAVTRTPSVGSSRLAHAVDNWNVIEYSAGGDHGSQYLAEVSAQGRQDRFLRTAILFTGAPTSFVAPLVAFIAVLRK